MIPLLLALAHAASTWSVALTASRPSSGEVRAVETMDGGGESVRATYSCEARSAALSCAVSVTVRTSAGTSTREVKAQRGYTDSGNETLTVVGTLDGRGRDALEQAMPRLATFAAGSEARLEATWSFRPEVEDEVIVR